jgi:hypothetical protein
MASNKAKVEMEEAGGAGTAEASASLFAYNRVHLASAAAGVAAPSCRL